MNRKLGIWTHVLALLAGAGSLLFVACDISSADDVTRTVSLNVSGSYQNGSGIAGRQSGTPITLLAVTQRGDQLTAVDNLGARWTGTVGRADGNLATVTLRGLTNTGVEVVITGTVTIDGTTGALTGTWIEPNLRSTVSATATVQPVPTPVPTAVPGATATPVPGATATPVPGATPTPTPFIFPTAVPPPLPG